MTTQDKLADALLAAKYPHIPCAKYDDLLDFHFAVGGEGPLAYEWSDKPHRLVFRLTTELSELRDSIAAIATAPQPAPKLEKWEIDSMQTLADALEKRGDDLSTDSASWLRKYLMLAAAPQPTPDECFCDRMYPDSNPNASCGDCPTRDYAPQPAPAHVQVDVLSELADEIEEAYPNADASNLRAFAAAHPPAPAAGGAVELPPLPHGDAFCDIADWNEESIGMCGAWSEHLSINSRYTMPLYTESSVRTYTRSAIAALRQPVADAVREDVLIRQLRGRAAFLRNRGRVKSPALMEEAASRLESAIASQQESRNG